MIERLTKLFPKIPGVYLVGGSVRDHLLGKKPVDYDLVVPDNPGEYGRRIASSLHAHLVEIGKPGQTIVRVVSGEIIVDISAMEGETISADMKRRDFTINAMAYELASEKFIDENQGQQDLKHKVIRMLSPRAFVSDPLRLLRAFRMAACLDFKIEPQTLSAIEDHAERIRQSAGERIRDELFKMLQSDTSHSALLKMANSGLFLQIFPDFTASEKKPADPNLSRGITNGTFAADERLQNTFAAYSQLEKLLKAPAETLPPDLEPYYQDFKDSAKALLKFCILWHDIGSPANGDQHAQPRPSRDPAGSAEIARRLCRRYRFANRHTDFIHAIIANQARPFSLFEACQKNTLVRKDVIRLFMMCRQQTPALMLHALAVMYGRHGKDSSESRAFLALVIHLLQEAYSDYEAKAALPPLISGRDLIREFGLTPSPLFKKILFIVEEERLSAEAMSRSDALQMVKKILAEQE
jgi:tRNA nucleotidyltransferase/poly(A) polymerase